MTVAQINVLRLRIPVPESIAAKVRIGDSADVHVQATGEHFTGKVARFTDSLDHFDPHDAGRNRCPQSQLSSAAGNVCRRATEREQPSTTHLTVPIEAIRA